MFYSTYYELPFNYRLHYLMYLQNNNNQLLVFLGAPVDPEPYTLVS
jgi:hypothetical protein